VYELRVERHANNFHAAFLEFCVTLVECNQFRRAHKGEIHRPEKQNGCFSIDMFFEVEVFNDFATSQNGCSGKIRRLTSYQYHEDSLVLLR